MRVSDFDYVLPEELIAQEPWEPRDHSRLLVVHRAASRLEHRIFKEVVSFLEPGDALVLNHTRVFPARLQARRADNGREVEVFLLRPAAALNQWEALVKPGRRARPGSVLLAGPLEKNSSGQQLEIRVLEMGAEGWRRVEFFYAGKSPEELAALLEEWIEQHGLTPLPPYINRAPRKEDRERYQTVYARVKGSVAAPTAGLHFTPQLLREIEEKGVKLVYVLLHVGIGTFRPVRTETVEEHRMHQEYYELAPEAAEVLNQTRERKKRIVAVGTTSVRVLESCADAEGRVLPGQGWTDLFIYPGYHFKAVDALITNFHLPRSTLLMLVAAFAGQELIRHAYVEAVRQRYRFFSYGDAMLII